MSRQRVNIAVSILVLLIYGILLISSPKRMDWTLSLSGQDKIPYGAYVVFHQLGSLFHRARISRSATTADETLRSRVDSGSLYLVLARDISMDSLDTRSILSWVSRGNQVFLAAQQWDGPLMDSLGLSGNTSWSAVKSGRFNFVNPLLRRNKNFGFPGETGGAFFPIQDSGRVEVLGTDSLGNINFARISEGRGAVYVNAIPLAFTNYAALYGNQCAYINGALSYIPQGTRQVIWDQYYKKRSTPSRNPLRAILGNEDLKWAWYLALVTLLLYVLFNGKRTQRVIPVILPLQNTSLEFAETVGRLYYQRRDNKNIAEKMINALMDHFRRQFRLSPGRQLPEFRDQLARRAGLSQEKVRELLELVDEAEHAATVSDELLLRMDNCMDQFYTND
ncbi:MAG TPA: DUF4350 domain-containing protein [Chitinophagaceae bacterium]|nr:DUF4350 domain-containing protein [Chitinophagaceae bacterium]